MNVCISLGEISDDGRGSEQLWTLGWEVGLGAKTDPPSPSPLTPAYSRYTAKDETSHLENHLESIMLPGAFFMCQGSGDFSSIIANQENTASHTGDCLQCRYTCRGYRGSEVPSQLSDHQWAPSDVKEKPEAEGLGFEGRFKKKRRTSVF